MPHEAPPSAPSAARRTAAAVTPDDVPALAAGAAIFGTGGGGAVHTVRLATRHALDEHGPVPLLTVADLGEDDLVISMSGVGAPFAGIEMLPADHQPLTLRDEIEELAGRPVTAVMATEIGGSNGVGPAAWAARLGIALLDADTMGRAFPEATMTSTNVAGVPRGPIVMSDVVGNVSVLRTVDSAWLERHVRANVVASGAIALGASFIAAGDVPGAVIEGSVSRAIAVGRRLLGSASPVEDLADELDGDVLVSGKVIDVERRNEGGFTRGSATIAGVGPDRDRLVRVEIQNENLVVLEDGQVLVSVPDLITIVDSETGEAISTELLRFGQRVSVLAWACDPLWRTPRGLELTGPRAFGYEIDYAPFGAVKETVR
ncbi:DUF917 domain-containing protein [Microbacterium marinilacus]|uniref:DUF917 domain-containing protein n=1 Tax=Microbacterium marinilacus TaxID=415209 RepID=A0ABP7BRV2_9MICO|nr:DUF917 domain-containing protein [Microbacterium marinilacus]MBY0690272.1 DUF917 domain-containing protein [Microbacterium marinilacus]